MLSVTKQVRSEVFRDSSVATLPHNDSGGRVRMTHTLVMLSGAKHPRLRLDFQLIPRFFACAQNDRRGTLYGEVFVILREFRS